MFEKQKLLFNLAKKNKSVLEIGVYMGHSLLIMLLANPKLKITCIDIEDHYSLPAIKYLKDQKFSNPLKNLYYNIIQKEKLNSIESVSKLLKKYETNINLIQGNTNTVLKKINLSAFDFVFVDGGHSYTTVKNDLDLLFESLKKKKAILLCDEYRKQSFIPEVRKAIDDFADINNLKINLIENRFAEIIT
jgi:predicted O-methyltransferase YrrM